MIGCIDPNNVFQPADPFLDFLPRLVIYIEVSSRAPLMLHPALRVVETQLAIRLILIVPLHSETDFRLSLASVYDDKTSYSLDLAAQQVWHQSLGTTFHMHNDGKLRMQR